MNRIKRNVENLMVVAAYILLVFGVSISFLSTVKAEGLGVDGLLLNVGSQNRVKIIKLEAAKQKIQDTVSVYKKGMSKAEKDQLSRDLKALRKCKFRQPCVEEMTGRKVSY